MSSVEKQEEAVEKKLPREFSTAEKMRREINNAYLKGHREWLEAAIKGDPVLRYERNTEWVKINEESLARERALRDAGDKQGAENEKKSRKEKQQHIIDDLLEGKENSPAYQEALSYPGLTAIAVHEVAKHAADHAQAREWSEWARGKSGIDIHPDAKIGRGVFFDHGTSDVIGQDVKIGDGSVIYQQVTLGANGEYRETEDGKLIRHPHLGNNVVCSTQVGIYGPAEIGDGVKIMPQSMIFGKVKVGDYTTINPGTKIVVPKGQTAIIAPNQTVVNPANAPDTLVQIDNFTKAVTPVHISK